MSRREATRWLAAAACLLLPAAPCVAAAIDGTVLDAATRAPIADAIVTVDGTVSRTDAHGAFHVQNADSGAKIAVRAVGYGRALSAPSGTAPLVVKLTALRPHAVYLSVYGISSATLRDAAVALRASNGINALVIDAKGDRGLTPWPSMARGTSGAMVFAERAPQVRDLAALLAQLHAQGFYLIARIVTFKDDPLARAHPEWAVRDAAGNVWQDREGQRWIDPFARDAWREDLTVAVEAARLGFDEIQFDYVRFPDSAGLRFMQPNTRENRTAAITGFLLAARDALAPYNVFVSADIFGYVCWNLDDTAIGQQLETLGAPLDYISPMLYPSGFTWGLPGCTKPTADPGQIVRRSLTEAQRRTGLPGVRFRPWLQAFRDYAFDRREFDADEILAQINAADAAGTDGWMLWNPRNRYDPEQLPHGDAR